MALKFTDNTTKVNRTTNLVSPASNTTVIVWFKPDANIANPDYYTVFAYLNAGYTLWHGLFSLNDNSQKYQISVGQPAVSFVNGTTVFQAGHWYPLVYRRIGTIHSFWTSMIDAHSIVGADISASVYSELLLGYDGTSKNSGTSFKNFREWSTDLTTNEMIAEINSPTAVKTANLVCDCPLTSDLLDLTSNHNNFTAVGAGISFTVDDPVPATGTLATNPIAMGSLPYTTSPTIKPTNVEFWFDAWFKYTAVTNEVYIGGWLFGDLTNYKPRTLIYSDAGATEYPPNNPIGTVNRRFQMPVVVGNTYYFNVVSYFNPPTSAPLPSAVLTVDFLTAPREFAPVGSLLINDDLEDFGAAILSSVNGDNHHVLNFFSPFIPTNSEGGGDMVTDGSFLIANDIINKFQVYNPQLGLVTTTVAVSNSAQSCRVRTAIDKLSWYVINPAVSPILLTKIALDGSVVQQWTIPAGNGGGGMAPNADESIVYIIPSGVNQPVRRWLTATSALGADLVGSQGATYIAGGILVLNNTDIVVGYATAAGLAKFVRFNTAGTIQGTTGPLGAITKLGDFSQDLLEPDTYFRARVHGQAFDGSTSLLRIRIADMVIVAQTDYVEYENGVYNAALTTTPIAKFGPSLCCPFFLIRQSISPIANHGGIYRIVPNKRNDTLWDVFPDTEVVKIPDPQFKTALLGD